MRSETVAHEVEDVLVRLPRPLVGAHVAHGHPPAHHAGREGPLRDCGAALDGDRVAYLRDSRVISAIMRACAMRKRL